MARQLVSVSYCVVFTLVFVLPFSANSTKLQNNKENYLDDEKQGGMAFWGDHGDKILNLLELSARFIPDKSDNVGLYVKTILGASHLLLNKYFENTKKIDKTKSFFLEIERQLNEQRAELQTIHQAIKQLSMTAGYSKSEHEIVYSLETLRQYLEVPQNVHLQKKFHDQSITLPKHLNNILDGLLGKTVFNADIMTTLRDFNNCHGRKLQDQIGDIMKIITAGFFVHYAYQEQVNVADEVERSFIDNSILESTLDVRTRLDKIVRKCQEDESSVKDEMKAIIEDHPWSRSPPTTSSQELIITSH